MRTVESQITSVYPSQTNFVVEATFTWDHDVTLVYYGSTTVTLKAGEHLPVDGACFRPGGTKITAQISSGSYPVGLSACKCATIEMYDGGWQNVDNRNLYEGATVHLKANIKIDGNGYLVPMGSFKVYEVETVHEVTTLTCYDAMREADVLCPTEMQGEHNYIELWRLAATRLGLTPSAIDNDLGYNALATVDAQHTIRQVIEAIALACGGNAVVSGDALYVRPITSTADVTLTQWINQLEVASTPVEVTGVRVKKTFASDGQEHTYFFGAGGYVIELNDDNLWLGIEGPAGSITVAAEAVAETAYEQLKNKPIYKFSGDLPADPRLDIFDKVIVKDINGREYPSIIMNYTFVFSGKTSIGNSVESSSSYNTSDSGPSGSSPSGGGGGNTIDVDSALSDTSTNPVQNKVVKSALDEKMDKSGGTFTGNVSGKYFTGTWLQTTEATDLGRVPGKIAVLDESGWVYYRTPAELLADIGAMSGGDYYTKTETDAAIAVRASLSHYGTTKLSTSIDSISKVLAATPYAVKTALDAAKAYADSVVTGSDYVTEQGSNDFWTWRKWASGIAELWAVSGVDQIAITTAWGSMYYGTWMDLPSNITARQYPFAFIATPSVSASYSGGDKDAWLISTFGASDDLLTRAPAYALARPTTATILTPRVSYYVVGKYK